MPSYTIVVDGASSHVKFCTWGIGKISTGLRLNPHKHNKTTIPVSFLYIKKETPMYGLVKRLDIDLQKQILQDCRSLLSAAPLYSNYAPRRGIGRRDCRGNCETCFIGGNVRQAKYKNTSFGPWGYYAPPCGSRYVQEHPTTGEPFPPIPAIIPDTKPADLIEEPVRISITIRQYE